MRLICLLSLVAFSALAAAPRDAGQEPTPITSARHFQWDVPGIVSEVEIPGTSVTLGVPVRLRAVTVKGKQDDIMRYQLESFRKQGLVVNPKQLDGPMLTGLDPETLITYTVLFQQNAPGYVSLILGEANVGAAKKDSGPTFAAIFPGAVSVVRSSFEGFASLGYMVPSGNEAKVRQFYEEMLPKAGYHIDPEQPLTFQRESEQIVVRIRQLKGAVSVLLMQRSSGIPANKP